MGSLTSTPKPRPVVQTVVAPAPAAAPVPQISEEQREREADELRAEERRENLLRRSRGRSGTITTGFRGLLDLASNDSTNNGQSGKTLLGQ